MSKVLQMSVSHPVRLSNSTVASQHARFTCTELHQPHTFENLQLSTMSTLTRKSQFHLHVPKLARVARSHRLVRGQ